MDDPQFEAVGFVKDGIFVDADGARVLDPLTAVEALAEWSPWLPFAEALAKAPGLPGVYLAREGNDGPIALTSGLGEAVADPALADAVWLRAGSARSSGESPGGPRGGGWPPSGGPTCTSAGR